MIIGAMNNPNEDILKEIKWIAKSRFDFIDLTLEHPMAHPDTINARLLKMEVRKTGLPLVGHTAWYLPIGSPFQSVRDFSVREFTRCIEVFRLLDVTAVNVHFDDSLDFLNKAKPIEFNSATLKELVKEGKKYSIKVMAENTPGTFSDPDTISRIFRRVKGLYLHWDIAHANVKRENSTRKIARRMMKKIIHIHASDNSGKGDEHKPIGKGNVQWKRELGSIKRAGYDKTITLEVFTSKRDLLESKGVFRRIWDSI